jgi:FlaA1/EpsC-like NDP-sugar epimerase
VLGTRNLVDAALETRVEHFVLISTDKAVNPTSVMGASKRVAELLVLRAAQQSGRRYVAVRFGNVLGSRGSVVPVFKRQIANGGPVTVSHTDMRRYFMTIPEAVQLVLQASVLGQSGSVLMLDMGEPVRIVDLARDLIELSGLEIGRDIDIVYSGVRSGEKLYEELFVPGEEYQPTQHDKILLARNASSFVPDGLEEALGGLESAVELDDEVAVRAILHRLLPEFCPELEDHAEKMTPPAPPAPSVPDPISRIVMATESARKDRVAATGQ